VLTDQGQTLHTLTLSGNSIAEIGVQAMPHWGSYWYKGSHSTLFSAERMA
jgi:hypothetical protein